MGCPLSHSTRVVGEKGAGLLQGCPQGSCGLPFWQPPKCSGPARELATPAGQVQPTAWGPAGPGNGTAEPPAMRFSK